MKTPPRARAAVARACATSESFAEHVLRHKLWSKTREIHRLLDGDPNIRLVVYGCHSSSKTHTGVASDLQLVRRHPRAKVVAIAPTGQQLTSIFWAEAHRQAKGAVYSDILPALHRRELVWPGDPGRGIIGIATDKPTNIRGQKGQPLRVHIEEINGVDESHFDDIWSLFSQANTQLYATMNPTLAAGSAYEMVAGDSDLFHVIRITAWDTPNMALWGRERDEMLDAILSADPRPGGPLDTRVVMPWLISPRFIRNTYDRCDGDVEHPLFQSRIDAIFPEGGDDVLVKLGALEAACRQPPAWLSDSRRFALRGARYVFSIDPAGRGGAECALCVIAVWWENGVEHRAIVDERAWMSEDARPSIASYLLGSYGLEALMRGLTVVDQTGLGHFWPRDLKALGIPNTRGLDYAGAARDPAAYVNRKAEWFSNAAQLFRDERVFGLSRGGRTFAQVAKVARTYDRKLRIGIEEKKGGAWDRSDAALQGLGFPIPRAGGKISVAKRRERQSPGITS